jgi:hypothetical protein
VTKAIVLAAILVAAATLAPARRNTLQDVKNLLQRPIIGPDLGQAEVATFCEKRVPRMPQVLSLEEWEQEAKTIRQNVLDRIVYRGDEAKKWRDYKARVEMLDTIPGGQGYTIRKLRYEAVPGLWIPALLYEPQNLKGKHPVFLNVNGHDANGKAAPYKQLRCINMAKRGIVVLNVEWLGMGQLKGMSHYQMNQMDVCGTSGLAPFYLAMRRGLDILMKLPGADKERVGVSGLSGGGWQTIFLSSLDERVTLCNAVAGYSSFRTRANVTRDLGDSEQTPNDLATVADYVHLTALRAPRPTLITGNEKDDCCFRPDDAFPHLVGGAAPIYKLYEKESALQTYRNAVPGTHNYEKDNREALYRFIGEHWYAGKAFEAKEIPSETEVKTAEELNVPLPEKNETLHSLGLQALRRAQDQRKSAKLDDLRWQRSARPQLVRLVRAPDYDLRAEKSGEENAGGTQATFWTLKIGGEWTVPAVELRRGTPTGTTILLTDEGRAQAAEQAEKLLAAGQRVIAVDPFYFGESKIKFSSGFLYVLLMHAVGQRALGVQSAQVAAIAEWTRKTYGGKVSVRTDGMRTSLIALVAAATHIRLADGLELNGELASLDDIVAKDWTVDKYPEMFCFGLLEKYDTPHLKALILK